MKTVTLERLIWVLIFGGLMLLSLSWFVDPDWPLLQTGFGLGGGTAAGVGVFLIYLRSRMKGDAS